MSNINPKKLSATNPDDTSNVPTRSITDLLPEVNKPELIEKFINNTINHAFQPEKSENVSGFIGRKVPYYDPATEFYIPESTHDRTLYQLSPMVVTESNNLINGGIFYQDLLNLIRLQGGNDLNHDRLFKEKYYSWAPPISIDMFVNYQNYLWLPVDTTPELIEITREDNFNNGDANGWAFTDEELTVYQSGTIWGDFATTGGTTNGEEQLLKIYNLNPATNSTKISFEFLKIGTWDIGSNERLVIYLDSEDAFGFTPLDVNESFPGGIETGTFSTTKYEVSYSITTETNTDQDIINGADRKYIFDFTITNTFASIKLGFGAVLDQAPSAASFGIDNIIVTQIIEEPSSNIGEQDYIVMERGCADGNPWSVNNRWYHIDDLTSDETDLAKNYRARRPIIQFNKDLELFNYGSNRIPDVSIMNTTLTNPQEIVGQPTYILDNISLTNGMRIMFTNPQISDDFGWDNDTFDGEDGSNGKWDDSIGITNDPNTLTFSNSSNQGIISGGTDFDTVFEMGQKIKISGSTSDGEYYIRSISPTSIFLNSLFDNVGLQAEEVTITLVPTLFKNKIFTVSGVGSFITLTETAIVNDGDVISILFGDNADNTYYWDEVNGIWILAQEKTTRNQKPLFELYDISGTKLNDPGSYPASTFAGGTIFSFSESDSDLQPIDPYLDIRIDYDQYGEILFQNNLEIDRYFFGSANTQINGYYFYRNYETNDYGNGWHLSPELSTQRLVSEFSLTMDTDTFTLEYNPINMEVLVNGILVDNYTVTGPTIKFDAIITKNSIVEFKYFTNDALKRTTRTSYELPKNLSANPFGEEIEKISRSDYLQHFLSLIENQTGFEGIPSGINNYRNLDVNLGVGTEILQHHNPMVKVMSIGANNNLNMLNSIKYSEREYLRFKNKLVNKITEYNNNPAYDESMGANKWLFDAISSINLAKNVQFPFSYNTITDSYIPATPSRLGIYPTFRPEKYLDLTLKNPIFVIQGHDGSITPAFNDFRDDVLIAFENFIYDSIPPSYKSEDEKLYEILDSVTTPFKSSDYSLDEFNQLLTPIILQWSAFEGIEFETNDTYDELDPFTYNYSSQDLPGYWRGIMKEYYGTDRPNTHPWEMFGFSQQPDWWATRYGSRPYKYDNPFLWDDMRNGVIFAGPRQGTYTEYARVGLPTPVDNDGNIFDPITLGLASQLLTSDQIKNWEVGDCAPAETVFRRSSHWPFAIALIGYLMNPAKFVSYGWDLNSLYIAYPESESPQLIDRYTGKRPGIDTILQGEGGYVSNGIQTWLVDYAISNGQSVLEFTSTIRNSDVRLGYKTAGFINQDTIRMLSDNVQARIPQENINVFLYQNPSVKELVYSGVIIEKVSNGWSVSGYDVLNNYFYSLAPDANSKKTLVNIGQARINVYKDYTDTIVSVPYGTTFNTPQQIYTFLIGYGEWLKQQGWVCENYDPGTNSTDDWAKMASDFVFWSQGKWASGSTLSLSPSSTNIKFETEHGFVENLNQLINGVYSIVDVAGSVIDQNDTFINRDGSEVIIQSTVPIFGIRLVVSEIEHVIVLDNRTIFNDLIYSPKLNLYQPRLRLQATRTTDWAGRINAPGYFVRGSTIVPNLEKSITDVKKFFDVDHQSESPVIQEISRRNIGYQSRSYLDQILISPTTQFQFYQGFIRNKGTLSTLSTLLRSGISSGSNDVTFYEEWALKLGDFGNVSNGTIAEFMVDDSELKTNIQLFEFSFSRLAANLSDTDLTALVENANNLPDSGIIKIDDEMIRYSSKIANTLLGLERGVLNTVAATHNQFTNFGLADIEYDSVITINPSDPRWINKPKILTNELFKVRSGETRRLNGEYLAPTDNRVAGYVLESEVFGRYNTIFDFTDDISSLLQDGDLEVNDQIWIDQMPSSDLNFPDQFQVYTIRLKDSEIIEIPIGFGVDDNDDPIILTQPLGMEDLEIEVSDAYNFPQTGIIRILDERIRYDGKNGNVLTIVERGFGGTNVGYFVDGELEDNGIYPDGTALMAEFDGYGEQVAFRITNNTYNAGDTILLENISVNYINVSGAYEVIESYDDIIRINLEILDSDTIDLTLISTLELIESHYHNEFDFTDSDYSLSEFELAVDVTLTSQSITLVSSKNLKAPGTIKINDEIMSYNSIEGDTLTNVGRGLNGTINTAHLAGDIVTRLKDIKVYIDTRSSMTDQFPTWAVKSNTNEWGDPIRFQTPRVDAEQFKNTIIYNNATNSIVTHLQLFDPAKGYYAGQVAAEIDYRLDEDPCNYKSELWGVGQLGQVWWNTRNAIYENYESGSNFYRSNNWGSLTPFSSIDVYEWVESKVLPADWTSNNNASYLYSRTDGEPFIDQNGNTPYITGEKTLPNGQTVPVYYFWVRDLSPEPPYPNRTYSVLDIANIILDPTSQGITWFAPCGPNGLLISNLNNMSIGDQSSIQLSFNNVKNLNDPHTQWTLMREGDEISNPPDSFWDQMRSSLAGMNVLYQPIPDVNVDPINRYGNLRRPRQSWFINDKTATKEFFKAVNRLFMLDQVVDRENFDAFLEVADGPTPYGTTLASIRPINPCEFSDPLNYSTNDTGLPSSYVVDNFAERNELVDSGQALIGDQILVLEGDDTGGFWRIYKVINVTGTDDERFDETCAESFKLTDFWDYADFTVPGFDINVTINQTYETYDEIVIETLTEGEIIEVTDFYSDGSNNRAIYKFEDGQLEIQYRQNGTMQFNVNQFIDESYGNDNKKITNSYYPNGVPGRQLAIKTIVDILKTEIFSRLETNLMFFKMINYVFSEQLNVDWAFKTTYIVGEGLNQTATQSPVFIFNRSQAFIDYIQEAKPYHTKLRDFRINQIIGTDIVPIIVTDFDKPVWYDPSIEDYRVLDPTNPADMAIMEDPESDQYWWSQFYNTDEHKVREIETTIYFDRVSCQASFGWDSAGFEDQVWEADIGEYLTAADRIVQSYRELPFSQTDVVQNKVNEDLNLEDLIPGCSFRGTIVNNASFKDLAQRPLGGWSATDDGPWSNTPWSPLASGSNIIDISDYNAIYQGNERTFKFTKTFNSDGTDTDFALGGKLANNDDVVVIVNATVLSEEDFTISVQTVGGAEQTVVSLLVPPATGTVIRISAFNDDSFNEPPVENSSDIIVDGYLFKQPYIDSDHPEELVINSIGESLSIHVTADGIASDGKVINRIYFGTSHGPFEIGQTAIADDSVMVFINGIAQPKDDSVYVISTDRLSITFRNNISLTGNDRIDVFSFGVGGEDIITELHQPLIVDTDTFTINELSTYPFPLVIIDGQYRTDYSISGDDLIMDSLILSGSNVDIIVFRSGFYTQFLQKKYDFIGSNIFDLGVTLPSPENAIVSINGVAQAIAGDYPDYDISGQDLIIFNKVKGRAESYNNDEFEINGNVVSGSDIDDLVDSINLISGISSYVDKGQLVIVDILGDPIVINDSAGGAGSMGISSDTYNSILTANDDIFVFMAPQDVAHYDTPTFNNVLDYSIPHDIIDANQITATLNGNPVTYTVDTDQNIISLDSNPGDGNMLQMVIKFINKLTINGEDAGTYNIGFVPFSSEQLFVLLNGIKLEYVRDYTLDGQSLTIPNSLENDEIQIYFFSSRNANGNGSFLVHFDQTANRVSQDYKASNIYTLGNNIDEEDTTLVLNNLTDFNYGRLILINGLNVEHIYVREKDVVKRQSISSYITLPNPITVINQLLVVANGVTLAPINDYNLNGQELSFTESQTNVEITVRYIIGNIAYNVIRNYDYSTPNSFSAGIQIFNAGSNFVKSKLYRLGVDNLTSLAQPLNWGDTEIQLLDAIDLPTQGFNKARMDKPGVIWINGERIEFWRRDGNTLKQVLRGTGGTSAGNNEGLNFTYRSQTATLPGGTFTQIDQEYSVTTDLLTYMSIGDKISVNGELVSLIDVTSSTFTIDEILPPSSDLTITVFKPKATVIPAGTSVYNIGINHEYEKGYNWVRSPFGLQFNTVNAMAKFINFDANK